MVLLAGRNVVPDRHPEPLAGIAALAAQPDGTAVRVSAETGAEALGPYLQRLALIAVEFPNFRDGRGFSLARALREHHGFKGEIRAVGKTLPDQYPFLLRCGFDTVELPAGHADPDLCIGALDAVTTDYQAVPGDGAGPLGAVRRTRGGASAA